MKHIEIKHDVLSFLLLSLKDYIKKKDIEFNLEDFIDYIGEFTLFEEMLQNGQPSSSSGL